eukprot:3875191-Pyramimonas_sp.AAC.1
MSVTPKVGNESAPKAKLTKAPLKKQRLQKAIQAQLPKSRAKAAEGAQAAEDEGRLKQQSEEAAWLGRSFIENISFEYWGSWFLGAPG